MKILVLLAIYIHVVFCTSILDQIKAADVLFSQEGATSNVLAGYDKILQLVELDDRLRSQIYFKRALIQTAMKKVTRAISDLRMVVKLDPNHKPAIARLNQLLIETGQFEDLIGDDNAQQVLELSSSIEKARSLFAQKDYPNCLHELDNVLASSPLNLDAYTLHFNCAYQLYLQEPHAKIGEYFVNKVLIQDLTQLTAIQPFNLQNYDLLINLVLFTESEFTKSNKLVKSCLRIDNEFKPCREMSKFQAKFSQLLTILEQYSILIGHYEITLEGSASPIEEIEIDYKAMNQLLFTDALKVSKQEKNTLPRSVKNNYEYLLYKAKNYPGSFSDDLTKFACESYIQIHDYKGSKAVCDKIPGTFLPKQIPEIDALLAEKKFNNAKAILELYNKNVQQTKLFKQRYAKIEEIYRQQQQEQYQQQQQYQQQYQQQHQRQQQQLFQNSNRQPKNDYYKLLDIPRDADEKTIKKGYRAQTLKYHPDKCLGTNLTQDKCEEKMQEINKAYEVLSDKELKSRYDRGDDPMDHTQPQQQYQQQYQPHGQPGGQFFHQFFGSQGNTGFKFGGQGFGNQGFGGHGQKIKIKKNRKRKH